MSIESYRFRLWGKKKKKKKAILVQRFPRCYQCQMDLTKTADHYIQLNSKYKEAL